MPMYKIPICWLGQPVDIIQEDGTIVQQSITEDMVEMKCKCPTELNAFFCMEGHMTECHVGQTCAEAVCSHYDTEEELFDESDL